MKVLVTGADGFIGSHLAEELVKLGHEVRAFVQYNSFNSWGWLDSCEDSVKEQLEVFSGDIRDPSGVNKAVKGCDAVLHLAALIAIPYSYHSPHTYLETNVSGTLNVLEAVRNQGVSKMVHTSTSEVYGTAKFVPITESHRILGQSPYSATKIAADALAYSFFASFNLPVTILRPFNTYGPRQSARAVIPTIIAQVANGAKEIKLGAIEPTRDFNYVADTVAGFVAALSTDGIAGEVINIGSGYEISIGKTVEIILDVIGSQAVVVTDEQRIRPDASEVERLWACNEKAKKLLNWQPRYGGIEGFKRGVEHTVAWFLDPKNLALYKHGIYNI